MKQSIREIMTRRVASVSPEQSIIEAAKLMNEFNVGSVPVVDNNQIRGILTDRDIVIRAVAEGKDISKVKAQEVMSNKVITASPEMDVHEAAEVMAKNQIRRLPVVETEQLVGMVALGDLAVVNIYQNEAGEALSDISIPARPLM